MASQQFCLRWNNHQPNFVSVFASLLNSKSLVDVTLAAEGKHVQAHKVVLSACSSYFQNLFAINPCQHPIVILKDVKYKDLQTVVDFMYYGEVNVTQEQLSNVLKTAEMLKIKGLAEVPEESLPVMKSKLSERQGSSLESSHDSVTHQLSWGSARSDTIGQESGVEGSRRSPSPCGSPTSRKRIRKSSTGSRSSSAERNNNETSCEVQENNSTLIIKAEPLNVSHDGSEVTSHERSLDSEHRDGSLESATEDKTTPNASLETPAIKEVNAGSAASPSPTPGSLLRSKRGRTLIRQPRIKKESEMAHSLMTTSSLDDPPSFSIGPSSPSSSPSSSSTTHLLTAPPRIERHLSEPPMSARRTPTPPPLLPLGPSVVVTTTTSGGPSSSQGRSPSYLVVPTSGVPATHTATLQKQRSQPLPSSAASVVAATSASGATMVQRQHSQPSLPHIQLAQTQPTFQLAQGMSKLPLQVRVVPATTSSVTSSPDTPMRERSPSIVIEHFPLVRVVSADNPSSSAAPTPSVTTLTTPKPLAHIRPKSEDLSSSVVVTTVPHPSPAPARSPSPSPVPTLQHQRSTESAESLQRSGHCPVLRQGPALGCNFCWNTIDDHGRILRRKTKYCCPECKTNLCIVPCFQQYHHKHDGAGSSGGGSAERGGGSKEGSTDEEFRSRSLPKTSSV